MNGTAIAPQSISLNPARILIVDDHPNTASMLARALKQFNKPVEVLTARSGPEALEIMNQGAVEVLITDFMMPGMNGLELIEKAQKSREPGQVILVTAYDSPGLAATARRLKVNHYLIKPVQPEKIRDLVSRALDTATRSKSESGTGDLPAPSNFRILIAEDQSDNIHLLSTRLKSEGYTFIVAMDGQETLDKVQAELPDLVLLDVNMPRKNGFEVLAEIRSDPRTAHIPVIVLTAARTSVRDIREGLGLGADDYITKPFDWRELAARVRSKLRVKHAEDQLRRRNRELSLLPEIGQDLSARTDVEELSGVVLQRAVNALSAASSNLVVFGLDDQRFYKTHLVREVSGWDWSRMQSWLATKGLIAQVANSGQGALLTDTETLESWPRQNPAEASGAKSAICVPLLGRRGVVGTLMLVHEQANYFTNDHLGLLQAIASQAAIAIENAQLHAVERKRVNELVALNGLTHTINQFTRQADLLEKLPDLVRESFDYSTVTLWWLAGDDLRLKSSAGLDHAPRTSILGVAPTQVAATGQPAFLSGIIEERSGDRARNVVTTQLPMHTTVAVPLKLGELVKGVLAVHSRQPNAYQESDRVLLETIAGQVTSALERINLFESVEHEQERLSAVLRSAPDAILVCDANGAIQLINPAGTRLFTDIEVGVGRVVPSGYGYDELVEFLSAARAVSNPGLTTQEINWPDKRVFNVMVMPMEDGGQVVNLHDVTHFKDLERVKSEFLATASHDLKNPLTAIMGFSDLLQRIDTLTPRQSEFIQRIKSASGQMLELVQDLMELARIDMGIELKYEQVDLRDVVSAITEEFRGQAGVKQQIIFAELGTTVAPVSVDMARIKQVLRNLAGNAIKYTPAGGQVCLTCNATPHAVIFQVRDTGLGIPEADLPHIFDKFYRVQADDREQIEGSGLGLAIVKAIVEQHGGQIAVESIFGKGTCFTVSLPLASTA